MLLELLTNNLTIYMSLTTKINCKVFEDKAECLIFSDNWKKQFVGISSSDYKLLKTTITTKKENPNAIMTLGFEKTYIVT